MPRRFCLECGRRSLLEENRYQAGDSWREEGKLWVRCGVCEGVKETTKEMEREWVGEGRMGWIMKTVEGAACCAGCWGEGDKGQQSDRVAPSHTTKSPTMPASSPTLTTLPTEMRLLITSHLRHLDRYTFRLTSRQFYTLIRPPALRVLRQVEFRDSLQPREERWLVCNTCERLRRIQAFDESYLRSTTWLHGKKFCAECLESGRRLEVSKGSE